MKSKKRPSWLVCPECKEGTLHVVSYYKKTHGMIIRYRRCDICHHRACTVERIVKKKTKENQQLSRLVAKEIQ